MKKAKIILGLTGNIATGKSVVRRMLENYGALGIDADQIAHRTLYPGGAAYQPLLDTFGTSLLDKDGSIARARLGAIVFDNPEKLAQLEALIHPAVSSAIQTRINNSKAPLVVIEAIKLLESDLVDLCDSIWVSDASEELQLERLLQFRGMSLPGAQQRIAAQPPQAEKRSRADFVIQTAGSFDQTWQQVGTALNDTIQLDLCPTLQATSSGAGLRYNPAGCLDPAQLTRFWNAQVPARHSDLFETLAFSTLMPILYQESLDKILLWDSWNFTGSLQTVLPHIPADDEVLSFMPLFAPFFKHQMWELIIVADEIVQQDKSLRLELDLEPQSSKDLTYPAWRQAVLRQTKDAQGTTWVKVLTEPIEKLHPIHRMK